MDSAEDLDVAMPMYNLIEYMQDYSKKPATLWNYYGDRQVSINEKQMEIMENEFSVPLKHLNTFWRTLDTPLINCKVSLILTSRNLTLT